MTLSNQRKGKISYVSIGKEAEVKQFQYIIEDLSDRRYFVAE